jgi:hypothetical protein
VAALLTALALIGGPDMLDTTSAPAQPRAGSVEPAHAGHDQARDDTRRLRRTSDDAGDHARPGARIADRGAPDRHWLPALPPSSSQSHVPASVRLAAGAAAPQAPSAGAVGVRRTRYAGAGSPPALQVLRC